MRTLCSTAYTAVLVGAGGGRVCHLWHRRSVFRKGKMILNNASRFHRLLSNDIFTFQTLVEWRGVFKEFSTEEDEERYRRRTFLFILKWSSEVVVNLFAHMCLCRIVVVKQTQDILPPLNNVTLVDVVMRSILPSSRHLLSANEVADAIETHLQTREDVIWPSWTVRHRTQWTWSDD